MEATFVFGELYLKNFQMKERILGSKKKVKKEGRGRGKELGKENRKKSIKEGRERKHKADIQWRITKKI